jgi:hypothetical protein
MNVLHIFILNIPNDILDKFINMLPISHKSLKHLIDHQGQSFIVCLIWNTGNYTIYRKTSL